MIICKVVGHVWATKKDEKLEGKKLMVVQQTNEFGEESLGEPFVAADIVGAGIGERVLVVNGSTARMSLGGNNCPVDSVIVGIIDSLEVDRSR